MRRLTDEEIIHSIKAGKTAAFKELVKRYESRVAATVIGMLGHCPEAEDVGQETFIRFYNGLNSFQGNSSVATYLTRIAINLSLNELKRRKRRALFLYPKPVEEMGLASDDTLSALFDEEREIVQKALDQLDPKFRMVVVLRLIEGFSTAETASILKLPPGTVLSRLARAQAKLKEILVTKLGEIE